jgi:hypothetical protein
VASTIDESVVAKREDTKDDHKDDDHIEVECVVAADAAIVACGDGGADADEDDCKISQNKG